MGIGIQTVAPTVEPVSLAEAKAHLRVDGSDEDDQIRSMISAAREMAEAFTNRQFCTATWAYKIDDFPDEIILPHPPLGSVSSIAYIDTAGASQTLATTVYTVNTSGIFSRIYLAYSQVWPAVRDQQDAVTITYTAGYGLATAVPNAIRQAVKIIVAQFHEHREPVNVGNIVTEMPMSAHWLLWPYRAVLKT